jgi:hypothetical protein
MLKPKAPACSVGPPWPTSIADTLWHWWASHQWHPSVCANSTVTRGNPSLPLRARTDGVAAVESTRPLPTPAAPGTPGSPASA